MMTFVDAEWEPISLDSKEYVVPSSSSDHQEAFSYSGLVHFWAKCAIASALAFVVVALVTVAIDSVAVKALSALFLIAFAVSFVFWIEQAKRERQIQPGQVD